MSAFIVNTNVMAKVVTAILLNRDTFDGESTCRSAFLAAPTDAQKEAGTTIGRKLFLLNRGALHARYGCSTVGLPDFVFGKWAAASPVAVSRPMCSTSATGSRGSRWRRSLSDTPWRSGITRNGMPRSSPTW